MGYPFFGSINVKEIQHIFGLNDSYKPALYEKILYLVKWGFSREEAFFIPLPELECHIRGINKHYEKQNEEADTSSEQTSTPRYAGNTVGNAL